MGQGDLQPGEGQFAVAFVRQIQGAFQIGLAHRYQPSVATAEKFLTSQGRRKFVLPLFQTLWNEGDWGRANARRIYAEARPLYHPVTAGSVDELVGRP